MSTRLRINIDQIKINFNHMRIRKLIHILNSSVINNLYIAFLKGLLRVNIQMLGLSLTELHSHGHRFYIHTSPIILITIYKNDSELENIFKVSYIIIIIMI